MYTEIKQFAADVRQVFSNCYRYNVNNNKLVKIARDLQVSFSAQGVCVCYVLVSDTWTVSCLPDMNCCCNVISEMYFNQLYEDIHESQLHICLDLF